MATDIEVAAIRRRRLGRSPAVRRGVRSAAALPRSGSGSGSRER